MTPRRSLMNMLVLTAIWFLSFTQFSLYTEMRVLRTSSARWMLTSWKERVMMLDFSSVCSTVRREEALVTAALMVERVTWMSASWPLA